MGEGHREGPGPRARLQDPRARTCPDPQEERADVLRADRLGLPLEGSEGVLQGRAEDEEGTSPEEDEEGTSSDLDPAAHARPDPGGVHGPEAVHADDAVRGGDPVPAAAGVHQNEVCVVHGDATALPSEGLFGRLERASAKRYYSTSPSHGR